MKHYLFLVALLIAAGCGGSSAQWQQAEPAEDPQDDAAGTEQVAPADQVEPQTDLDDVEPLEPDSETNVETSERAQPADIPPGAKKERPAPAKVPPPPKPAKP